MKLRHLLLLPNPIVPKIRVSTICTYFVPPEFVDTLIRCHATLRGVDKTKTKDHPAKCRPSLETREKVEW
jgi:hypothetical protein